MLAGQVSVVVVGHAGLEVLGRLGAEGRLRFGKRLEGAAADLVRERVGSETLGQVDSWAPGCPRLVVMITTPLEALEP